jgi:DNA-directed RNA polymerase alpha subunit
LLSDLDQIAIIAIKLEGAMHELSRLPGIRESILDVLFQFRKIVLQAPFLKLGKTVKISFLFSGPGLFLAKDILFPKGVQCRNLEVPLLTLSPGAILRGHFLIRKNLDSSTKRSKRTHLGEPWYIKPEESFRRIYDPIVKKFQKPVNFPWIRIGFQSRTIERVGFRIEHIGPWNQKREILIFEILANGRISPRQALRESSILLVNKFLDVAQRTIPMFRNTEYISTKRRTTRKRFLFFLSNNFTQEKNVFTSKQTFYNLNNIRFSRLCEPLGLDLRNLDLGKERYRELQSLGIITLGQLLERLTFEANIFSPLLQKQRRLSLFRLGLFPILFTIMDDILFFTKTVGRRKTAIANIKLIPGSGKIQINNRTANFFFR